MWYLRRVDFFVKEGFLLKQVHIWHIWTTCLLYFCNPWHSSVLYIVCTSLSFGAFKTIALFSLWILPRTRWSSISSLSGKIMKNSKKWGMRPWGCHRENRRSVFGFMVRLIESRQFRETTEKDLEGYYWEGLQRQQDDHNDVILHECWVMSVFSVSSCGIVERPGQSRSIDYHKTFIFQVKISMSGFAFCFCLRHVSRAGYCCHWSQDEGLWILVMY